MEVNINAKKNTNEAEDICFLEYAAFAGNDGGRLGNCDCRNGYFILMSRSRRNHKVYHVSLYQYCAVSLCNYTITIEAVSCQHRSLTPFYTAKGIYIYPSVICV